MYGSRWFKGNNSWYKYLKRLKIWWWIYGNYIDLYGMIFVWYVKINVIYSVFVYVDKWGCLKLIKFILLIVIIINK